MENAGHFNHQQTNLSSSTITTTIRNPNSGVGGGGGGGGGGGVYVELLNISSYTGYNYTYNHVGLHGNDYDNNNNNYNYTNVSYPRDEAEDSQWDDGSGGSGHAHATSSLVFQVSLALTLTLLTLATILSNAFVMATIYQSRKLHTPANFLIASLALTDLLVSLLVMPISALYTVSRTWTLGQVVCDIWLSSDITCCTASILHLCVIALDRYWAITDAVEYTKKRTNGRAAGMIATAWVIAISISLPPFFWRQVKVEEEVTSCNVNTDHIFYTIYSTFGAFYIPTLLLLALYGRIYVEARKRILKQQQNKNKNKKNNHVNNKNENENDNKFGNRLTGGKRLTSARLITDSPCSVTSETSVVVVGLTLNYGTNNDDETGTGTGSTAAVTMTTTAAQHSISPTAATSGSLTTAQCSNANANPNANVNVKVTVSDALLEKKRISAARERKATKTLGIILGAYIVCWLPFFIYTLVFAVCETCFRAELFDIFTWLGYLNSLINPIIYTMSNEDFKRAFHKLIQFRCCRA